MAWFNGGNWDGLKIKWLPTILAELTSAVTQRENIVYGTTTPLSAPEDFDGIRIPLNVGPDNDLREVVSSLRVRIQSLLSERTRFVFVRGSGSSTTGIHSPWTLSDALMDAGYGSGGWMDFDRAQNATVYIQMRDVLDRMTRIGWSLMEFSSAAMDFAVCEAPFVSGLPWNNSIAETCWDVARGAISAPPGYTLTVGTIDFQSWIPGPFFIHGGSSLRRAWVDQFGRRALLLTVPSVTFRTSEVSGELIKGRVVYIHYQEPTWPGTLGAEIDGHAVASPVSDLSPQIWDRGSDWPNIGTDTEMEMTYDVLPENMTAGALDARYALYLVSRDNSPVPYRWWGSDAAENAGTCCWTNIQSLLTYG